MPGQYSFITFRTEDWRIEKFIGRDGKSYQVTGYVDDGNGGLRCPTEICGALCCVKINWKGVNGQRCEFLTDDLRCMFQAERGMACKPMSCAAWPKQQLDVDFVNERWAQGAKRCCLKVEEV